MKPSCVETPGNSGALPESPEASILVARQPIFQPDLNVYGYELLFRCGSSTEGADIRAALRLIAAAFLSTGAEPAAGKRPGFIRFNHTMLAGEYAALLPKKSAVIEVLESLEQNEETVEACCKLKSQGYTLAVQAGAEDCGGSLRPLADIVKVDFQAIAPRERPSLVRHYGRHGAKLLAGKIGSSAEFREAREAGFALFQGLVFGRPANSAVTGMPTLKAIHLELLGELGAMRLDYVRLSQVLRRDTSVSYKLLRFLNSPLFGWSGAIASIEHGLALIGEEDVRKWISVVTLSGFLQNQPTELMVRSLFRAAFCETLSRATELWERSSEMFLMALLSLVGAMLNCPLEAVLNRISLKKDIRDVLLGKWDGAEGTIGNVYHLVLSYEDADWNRVSAITTKLRLKETSVADAYVRSIAWADQVAGQSVD